MVRVSYNIKIKAPFQQVWRYFANFENIAQYDPCVKSLKLINSQSKQIGRKYDVTTLFRGKQGKMTYQVKKYAQKQQSPFRNYYTELYGSNEKVESVDLITVKQISNDPSQYNLLLQYQADMSFRGIYWFATMFASGTFNQIARDAQKSCLKKCIQKWGSAQIDNSSKKVI